MKKSGPVGFADLAVQKRKVKSEFFEQINKVVDWRPISNIINKHYQRGASVTGAPAYEGLLLFKMCLLQTWYGLSDYEVEDRVNDSISFSQFIGLSLDAKSPDHSVLSRFRTALTKENVFDKLFRELNKQLEKHKVIIRSGAIIDASITPTPLKPKGKTTYEIALDRSEEPRSEEEVQKEQQSQQLLIKQKPGVDTEGRWIKKAGKLQYGYKKHVITDKEGLLLQVLTTAANVHEISNLEQVLADMELPEQIPFYADKGYASQANRALLKKRKLKDRIQKKAVRGKALTAREKLFNRLISKTRYKVERTFGSIQRWFNSTQARYRGMAKMHTQHLMEAMAYNLYRTPGIIMSNRQK